MRLEVVKLDPIVKEAKYTHYTLHYKNDGKDFKRKLVSFSTGKVPYDAFKTAKSGDKYDVKLEKDDNGNWNWVEVIKVEGNEAMSKDGTTGKSGNWETAEERARRQVLIVRQSCLAQAIALSPYLTTSEIGEDVLKRAERFEEWVMRD
jgi:hypothetical protein